jgi:hypothetical protein
VTLDHPMVYRCMAGRLRIGPAEVAVPTDELARAIDQGLFPHVLPVRKLDALVQSATRMLRALGADDLEIVGESPADPTLLQARLRPETLERLVAGLRPLLVPWEHARLALHLRRLHASDELVVGLQQRFELELVATPAACPASPAHAGRGSP